MEYFAHIGNIQTFHDPEGYIEHMKTGHESVFVEFQLPGLARTNERAETHLFSICPLCNCPPENQSGQDHDQHAGEAQQNLKIHVAQYLKSLALMSLSWLEDTASKAASDHQDFLSDGEQYAPLSFEDSPSRRRGQNQSGYVDADSDGIMPKAVKMNNDGTWVNWRQAINVSLGVSQRVPLRS